MYQQSARVVCVMKILDIAQMTRTPTPTSWQWHTKAPECETAVIVCTV